MKARFDLWQFAALGPFLGVEETRYYLMGVSIMPAPGGGVTMAATDGHSLGVFYDAEGFVDAPVVIEPSTEFNQMIRHCLDTQKKGDLENTQLHIDQPVDHGFVVGRAHKPYQRWTAGAFSFRAIDTEHYPNWRKVILPSNDLAGVRLALAWEQLRKFAMAGRILDCNDKGLSFQVQPTGGQADPWNVIFPDRPFFGVVMPVKSKDVEIPEWALRT